jgi:hypothetical protein
MVQKFAKKKSLLQVCFIFLCKFIWFGVEQRTPISLQTLHGLGCVAVLFLFCCIVEDDDKS